MGVHLSGSLLTLRLAWSLVIRWPPFNFSFPLTRIV
jgi:hypothetical protein